MAKHLRTIAEDKRLEGKKGSNVEDGQVYGGKDASVNVNDPETVKFAKKHKVEKHDDRVGNGSDVYAGSKIKHSLDDAKNKRLRPAEGQYEEVEVQEKYLGFKKLEAAIAKKGDVKDPAAVAAAIGRKKYGKQKFQKAAAADHKMKENAECNHTEAGVKCPVHGNSDCSGKTGRSKHLLVDKKMNEATDTPEESAMVRTELRAIVDKANAMLSALKKDTHIEPWVQAKIANAKGMICGCHDYMMYGEVDEETLDEISKDTTRAYLAKSEDDLKSYKRTAAHAQSAKRRTYEPKQKAAWKDEESWANKQASKRQKGAETAIRKLHGGAKVPAIDEVLTMKTPASDVISDFVHSKDPKFKGADKKERIKRALGAYYGMHPEKSNKVHEDAAEPMLEGGKKKKKAKKESGPDTPIQPRGQVPSSFPNYAVGKDAPVNI